MHPSRTSFIFKFLLFFLLYKHSRYNVCFTSKFEFNSSYLFRSLVLLLYRYNEMNTQLGCFFFTIFQLKRIYIFSKICSNFTKFMLKVRGFTQFFFLILLQCLIQCLNVLKYSELESLKSSTLRMNF